MEIKADEWDEDVEVKIVTPSKVIYILFLGEYPLRMDVGNADFL